MGLKDRIGRGLARIVLTAGAWSDTPHRELSRLEAAALGKVFGSALDLSVIRVRENLRGLINLSGRAFVIENTIHLPPGRASMQLLVHEATHVWQFQNGGHAYITDSLAAQFIGDGYQLEKGLREGRAWAQLNCEQQATLVEEGWAQGSFEGARFVLGARDYTREFLLAKAELLAGRGATFT